MTNTHSSPRWGAGGNPEQGEWAKDASAHSTQVTRMFRGRPHMEPCEKHPIALAEAVCLQCLLDLEEQVEAAETRKLELWTRLLDMEGKYLDAANTLAHAEEFIEHQDMSYRWAEWCEGRDPVGVSEPETTEASDGTVPGTPGLDGSAERLSRPSTSGSETSTPASTSEAREEAEDA